MRRWPALVALLCLLLLAPAMAGRTCEQRPANPVDAQKAFRLALQLRETLDQTGANLVMVARIGRDMSKYHLRYSHIAFFWRDHPQGRWLAVHLLNDCGSASSHLYNEGAANFFLDSPYLYEALVLVPDPALQTKLASALAEPALMHEPHYNLVAYPFSTQFQNSNQWLLETMVHAINPQIRKRTDAQAWLTQHHFQPTTLDIPMGERLAADFFAANVAFNDHPFNRRMAGKIDTVTVESIVQLMSEQQWLQDKIVVKLPPGQ